jgi:AcrR family transcriptional regulator
VTAPGDARRREILEVALDLAGRDGLDAVSLGRLAAEAKVSKSGIAGLFGSKAALQLAAIDAARDEFVGRVLATSEGARGLERLRSLVLAWTDYLDARPYGCFFSAAALEWDGRPGPQRDAIAAVTRRGFDVLREEVTLARRLGELEEATDDVQLVFELHSYIVEANLARQLLGDPAAFDRARRAIASRLQAASCSSLGSER